MVWLEGLQDRLNRARIQLVERVGPIALRLVDEVSRTIDLEAWRSAPTLRERLGAVSWPRVGAGALAAAIGGLTFLVLSDRPVAYLPPEPTAREIALRREALRLATVTPPPSLVEANKSRKVE